MSYAFYRHVVRTFYIFGTHLICIDTNTLIHIICWPFLFTWIWLGFCRMSVTNPFEEECFLFRDAPSYLRADLPIGSRSWQKGSKSPSLGQLPKGSKSLGWAAPNWQPVRSGSPSQQTIMAAAKTLKALWQHHSISLPRDLALRMRCAEQGMGPLKHNPERGTISDRSSTGHIETIWNAQLP